MSSHRLPYAQLLVEPSAPRAPHGNSTNGMPIYMRMLADPGLESRGTFHQTAVVRGQFHCPIKVPLVSIIVRMRKLGIRGRSLIGE